MIKADKDDKFILSQAWDREKSPMAWESNPWPLRYQLHALITKLQEKSCVFYYSYCITLTVTITLNVSCGDTDCLSRENLRDDNTQGILLLFACPIFIQK